MIYALTNCLWSQCAISVREVCPGNITQCRACAEGLANRSLCPGSCEERGKCGSKWMEASCNPSPAPPTAQELKCYAVAEHNCAQNHSQGHAYAANYTECRACMEAIVPCPKQCERGTRCQGAWFETACHRLAPPVIPKPHPLPPAPLLGPAHCQIQVGVKKLPFNPTDTEVILLEGALFDSVTTVFVAIANNHRETRNSLRFFLGIYIRHRRSV
jgi:hypothetical protein